jgi:hypothetical protein
VLAKDVDPSYGITIHGTDVYFSDVGISQISIKRVPKAGGDVAVVLTAASETGYGFFALRADSENLYYRDQQGSVYARNKANGSTVTIAAGSGLDLDVNASVVYWNNDWWNPRDNPDPSPAPGILRANADGSEVRYVDSSKLVGWSSPRVDEQHLFYVRNGVVVRRSK